MLCHFAAKLEVSPSPASFDPARWVWCAIGSPIAFLRQCGSDAQTPFSPNRHASADLGRHARHCTYGGLTGDVFPIGGASRADTTCSVRFCSQEHRDETRLGGIIWLIVSKTGSTTKRTSKHSSRACYALCTLAIDTGLGQVHPCVALCSFLVKTAYASRRLPRRAGHPHPFRRFCSTNSPYVSRPQL